MTTAATRAASGARRTVPPPNGARIATALLVGTALVGVDARADDLVCVRYTVETISGPPCDDGSPPITYARAIRDGVIVGEYWQCGTSIAEGFVWSADGAFEVIPKPPGIFELYATDLNSTTVVGRMVLVGAENSPGIAFRFENGVVDALGALPDLTFSEADGINDAGLIVGSGKIAGKLQPIAWIDGVATVLPLPGWSAGTANDVNASGAVAGYMTTSTVLSAHAFLLDGADLVDAGFLDGGMASAQALNAGGAMVGYGQVLEPDGRGLDSRAFHWADGVMTVIEPAPGNAQSCASDINADGWVVGRCYGSAGGTPQRGFVWKDGVMVLLDDRIPADAGLAIIGAAGIDDQGVIAAWAKDAGGNLIAARLTPAPRVAADLDCDGTVDGADLGLLLAAWGDVGPGFADLNGDGVVDAADVGELLGGWGGVGGWGMTSPVPRADVE